MTEPTRHHAEEAAAMLVAAMIVNAHCDDSQRERAEMLVSETVESIMAAPPHIAVNILVALAALACPTVVQAHGALDDVKATELIATGLRLLQEEPA